MRKALFFAAVVILCAAFCGPACSQDATYEWEITDAGSDASLLTTWTVYTDKIEVQYQAHNGDFSFCTANLTIAQNGMMNVSTMGADDNTAFASYIPGFSGCEKIPDGITVMGRIYKIPSWFDCKKAFRIYYKPDLLKDAEQSFYIPEETRLPGLFDTINSAPVGFKKLSVCQSLLGQTIGCIDMQWWIGEYDGKPSLLFNGFVTEGIYSYCYDGIYIKQGRNSITEISEWGDNFSSATVECPNCCPALLAPGKEGTQLYGAIYNFPAWFDIASPFTLSSEGVALEFNTPSSCAASAVLDDAEQLDALRAFRDTTLAKTERGRTFIKLYYALSPTVIAMLEGDPQLKIKVKNALLAIMPMINRINDTGK